MDYQEEIRKRLNRTNIKYVCLYGFLALLCCGGALSGLLGDSTVRLLNIVSMPTQITGTIFLFLFVLMLIMFVRTLRAIFTNKLYRELCDQISEFGTPEHVLKHIGALPKNKNCNHGDLRFDEKYFSYILSDLCIVRPMYQVDWGYLQSEVDTAKAKQRRRSLQMPSTPSPVVDVLLEDNRVLDIRARNTDCAEKLLKEIKKANPEMSIGFTEKNAAIYKNDPKNMRSKSNIPNEDEEEEEEKEEKEEKEKKKK